DRNVLELSTLTITNTATDLDFPRSSIIYQLADPPAGVAIDQNGIITWTPSEIQGPGNYYLTTIATDTGSPPLSVTNTVSVTVLEANEAHILSGQGDHPLNELTGLPLTNTAVDADLPANVLSYQLLNAPNGASFDSQGVIV